MTVSCEGCQSILDGRPAGTNSSGIDTDGMHIYLKGLSTGNRIAFCDWSLLYDDVAEGSGEQL